MKRRLICFLWLLCALSASAAALPSAWQREQLMQVPSNGLLRLNLPVDTLNSARPQLEDLRIYDDAGSEVPYWKLSIPPIAQVDRKRFPARTFHVELTDGASVVTLQTGTGQTINGVILKSPADNFLKPVRIEGSEDGETWKKLGEGQPIFRQSNGAEELGLFFTPGVWVWLRLTVDDRRSGPIPLTGANIQTPAEFIAPEQIERVAAPIAERHENPGQSRLTFDLGGANLEIGDVEIDSDAPLFARQVTLAIPQVWEGSIAEEPVARGTIFRVAVEGAPVAGNLIIPVNKQIHTRQLLLLINNGDSAPLPIKSVRVKRRPVQIVFFATHSGAYHVLTGNSQCTFPSYDQGISNLPITPVSALTLSPPVPNPSYAAPEVLPGVTDGGVPLDVAAWEFRKPVKIVRAGAQQLELDLDVLAHAQSGLQDIRLARDGKQIPFIAEHTSIIRSVPVTATAAQDSKDPQLTRWTIELPQANLPVIQLACTAPTPLFQRDMTLYEEMQDDRGAKFRQTLGQATWVQTPGHTNREFVLPINGPLGADRIFLETRNGDNPPVELRDFRFFYPVSRLLSKATSTEPVYLYYGNGKATAPQYDLSLVGDQLVMADKVTATLAAEEKLSSRTTTHRNWGSGNGTVLLWAVLALVVVVLLWIIARLLPKTR